VTDKKKSSKTVAMSDDENPESPQDPIVRLLEPVLERGAESGLAHIRKL